MLGVEPNYLPNFSEVFCSSHVGSLFVSRRQCHPFNHHQGGLGGAGNGDFYECPLVGVWGQCPEAKNR